MIKLYFHPSPNPLKIVLYLEETGEPYEPIAIDTRKGEQHSDAFRAINPNANTPVMLDGGVREFDSNAMLIYLAEKTGKFVPPNTPANKANVFVADVRGHRHWPVLRAGGALQAFRRLLDEINAHPAAQQAEALKTKFTFKTELDDDARKMLFPSNDRLNPAGA